MGTVVVHRTSCHYCACAHRNVDAEMRYRASWSVCSFLSLTEINLSGKIPKVSPEFWKLKVCFLIVTLTLCCFLVIVVVVVISLDTVTSSQQIIKQAWQTGTLCRHRPNKKDRKCPAETRIKRSSAASTHSAKGILGKKKNTHTHSLPCLDAAKENETGSSWTRPARKTSSCVTNLTAA